MSRLKVISSGSSGNGYVIESCGRYLILELGCNFDEYIRNTEYSTSNIVACLVSHRHGDHIRKDTLDKFLKYKVPVFANDDVCAMYQGCGKIDMPVLVVGGFTIRHFDLVHSVPNTAYVIDTPDNVRILFATDTEYVPKIVKNVNVAIIEANYDENVIIDNIIDDQWNSSRYSCHQNINRCIQYLKKLDPGCMTQVVLCHLSQNNANRKDFVKKTQELLSFDNVCVAEPNLCLNLNNCEF